MRAISDLRRLYRLQRRQLLVEAALLKAALTKHGEAATLAALPISRTVLYGRIRLLGLSPECRAALVDGRLLSDVATFIADLPHREQAVLMRMAEGLPLKDALRAARRATSI